MESLEKLRVVVAARIRDLRIERGWSQQKLADELLISQSRLSELERGGGSFSAEQLLRVMMVFNVPIEHFVGTATIDDQLQNALARHGATHLRQADVVPGLHYEELGDLVRAALDSGDPRQITALAPVLVKNSAGLAQITKSSDSRVWWALENIQLALEEEESRVGRNAPVRMTYAKAAGVLDVVFKILAPRKIEDETLLDHNIRSAKSLELVKRDRSSISEKWRILTIIHPEDFAEALRAANG